MIEHLTNWRDLDSTLTAALKDEAKTENHAACDTDFTLSDIDVVAVVETDMRTYS